MQTEVDGEKVLRWLRQRPASEDAQCLLSCLIYEEQNPEVEHQIIDLEIERLCIVTTAGKFSAARISTAYFVDPSGVLTSTVNSCKTSTQRRFEDAKRYLAGHDVPATKLNGDAAICLKEAVEYMSSGQPLSNNLRVEVFKVLNKYSMHKTGLALAKNAIKVAHAQRRFDPYLYIQLASFGRECGALKTALTATQAIWRAPPGQHVPANALRILHSQRAAIQMDLFEKDKKAARLEDAQRSLNAVHELGGSDLLEATEIRLSKLHATLQCDR